MKPKAFLFDLNGTMINDMEFHIQAWFNILNDDLGAGLTYEQVRSHMYGKNDELFIRVFGSDRFSLEEMKAHGIEKERRYQAAYLPQLKLIDGLDTFLAKAKENNIQMAIGSAAIPFNINFVLDNLNLRHYFKAVVSADDVAISKPHPETYLKCAELLGIAPEDCLVFEDAPKGVEAAQKAGMKSIAITTLHSKHEFDAYDNILFFVEDYNDKALQDLL